MSAVCLAEYKHMRWNAVGGVELGGSGSLSKRVQPCGAACPSAWPESQLGRASGRWCNASRQRGQQQSRHGYSLGELVAQAQGGLHACQEARMRGHESVNRVEGESIPIYVLIQTHSKPSDTVFLPYRPCSR